MEGFTLCNVGNAVDFKQINSYEESLIKISTQHWTRENIFELFLAFR